MVVWVNLVCRSTKGSPFPFQIENDIMKTRALAKPNIASLHIKGIREEYRQDKVSRSLMHICFLETFSWTQNGLPTKINVHLFEFHVIAYGTDKARRATDSASLGKRVEGYAGHTFLDLASFQVKATPLKTVVRLSA